MNSIVRHATPRVDGARLLRGLDELAEFGAQPGPGITRTGLSATETDARHWLARRYRRSGLVARTDQAGNLIVHRPELSASRPVLLLGSHLDTVVHGGRLDGAYGVIAACEVVRTLAHSGTDLTHEPVAVAFTNEEGARFPYPFFGSLGLTGRLDVDRAATMTDGDGRSLADALRLAGGDLDTVADAAWPDGAIAGYLELHIEQGPVLEARDTPIGVVEAITGRTIMDVVVRGAQGHAGTTPMSMRQDALAAAAKVVLAVRELAAGRDLCRVSTVGRIDGEPNVTNVIPGVVRLTAEFRDPDVVRLAAAERALTAELARLARATGTLIDAEAHVAATPTRTDDRLSAAIAAAADELDLRCTAMSSGAGHDAQIVANAAPIGMIFVPSRDGVSHAPQEYTAPAHLVAGADTLLRTALRVAR
ncbi:allantoate amidohydrolase [Amycolatopsis sp. NPDC003861]